MTDTALSQAPPRSEVDAAVHIEGLRCRYGDFEAVRGVDLQIQRGEVFALLGTNGAGKTTTLEVIEGFGRASAGSVRVLGLSPRADWARLRARTGIMFQDSGLITELTVAETLDLWRQLVAREDDPDRLLARFELTDRRQVAVGQLSGGQRRRLDLLLALWGTPELVILDEPTTGLDPEARQHTWDVIGELTEAGRTVLLTTHYLEEAEALADRIAIMHEGRIAISGSLAEIVARRPAHASAVIPADRRGELTDLPRLTGRCDLADDGTFSLSTSDLQGDLTAVLGWAAQRRLPLDQLRAAPASLAEIYHEIRATDSPASIGGTHR